MMVGLLISVYMALTKINTLQISFKGSVSSVPILNKVPACPSAQKEMKLSLPVKVPPCPLHGGSVVKNLPVTGGDMNSIPDPGRCPHAPEQPGLCAKL